MINSYNNNISKNYHKSEIVFVCKGPISSIFKNKCLATCFESEIILQKLLYYIIIFITLMVNDMIHGFLVCSPVLEQ